MDFDGILVQFEVEFFDGFIRGLPDDGGNAFMREVVPDFVSIGGAHPAGNCLTVRWRRCRKG